METNIKYFSTDKTCCGRSAGKTTYFDGKGDESGYYRVFFEDGSSLTIYGARGNYAWFTKSRYETRKGKQRNLFIKNFDVQTAIQMLKDLEVKYGYTETNRGNVVIINPVGLPTQYQVDHLV